jgi:F-type H+-transporting ATPase subunit epsilon
MSEPANTFRFELVSPERLVMDAEAAAVRVPGTEGDFVVLPRHAPMMTTLNPGVLSVREPGKDEIRIFVRGGFADVTPQGLVVLAEEAIPVKELSVESLRQRIADAEEDLGLAKTDEERRQAREAIARLTELLNAAA